MAAVAHLQTASPTKSLVCDSCGRRRAGCCGENGGLKDPVRAVEDFRTSKDRRRKHAARRTAGAAEGYDNGGVCWLGTAGCGRAGYPTR